MSDSNPGPSGARANRATETQWSILVVDDSATARSQLRIAFEAKGARVIEAGNGQEGLWRVRGESIDLICTDVHMPTMDGLRMIQEIRKLAGYAATPIFVLTSDAAVTRAAEGKKAGATAWIIKPVSTDQLWKAVEKSLFGKSNALRKTAPLPIDPPKASKNER